MQRFGMKKYEISGFIEVSGERRKLAKGEATLVMDDERFGHIVLNTPSRLSSPWNLTVTPMVRCE